MLPVLSDSLQPWMRDAPATSSFALPLKAMTDSGT
jgi:hypothetical protein